MQMKRRAEGGKAGGRAEPDNGEGVHVHVGRGSRVGTDQRALVVVVPTVRSLGIVCVNQAKVGPPSGVAGTNI
jgi:hypothetical protein